MAPIYLNFSCSKDLINQQLREADTRATIESTAPLHMRIAGEKKEPLCSPHNSWLFPSDGFEGLQI